MNKKNIKIIVGIFIIIAIIGVCVFLKHNLTEGDKGSFNKMSMTIKGYTIDINSKEAGHPSRESYFNTSFEIKDNNHNITMYDVDFIDLKLESEFTSDEGLLYDMAMHNEVKINDKKFNYYIETSDENVTSATLYYRISDGALIIKVSGGPVYDSSEKLVKESAPVDKNVLESKELAKILNFTVNKERMKQKH